MGGAGDGAAEGGAEGAVEMPSVWLGVAEAEGVMEGVGVKETAEGLTVAEALMDAVLDAEFDGKDGKAEPEGVADELPEAVCEDDMDFEPVGESVPERVGDVEAVCDFVFVGLVEEETLGVPLVDADVLSVERGEEEGERLDDSEAVYEGDPEGEDVPDGEADAALDTVTEAVCVTDELAEREGRGEGDTRGERDADKDLVGEPVGVVVRLIVDEREPVREDEGEPAEEELGKEEPEFEAELDGDLDADEESVGAVEPDVEGVPVGVNEIVAEADFVSVARELRKKGGRRKSEQRKWPTRVSLLVRPRLSPSASRTCLTASPCPMGWVLAARWL